MENGDSVGGGGNGRSDRRRGLDKLLLECVRVGEERPSWPDYWLSMAIVVSSRGTCPRKLVGAVIVDDNQLIVSTGYNGAPNGQPHCDEAGCELAEIDGKKSCVRVVHAEENAIIRAGSLATQGCSLYTTVIPCYDCAKRIVQAGIAAVMYIEYYDSRKTVLTEHFLRAAGIKLVRA